MEKESDLKLNNNHNLPPEIMNEFSSQVQSSVFPQEHCPACLSLKIHPIETIATSKIFSHPMLGSTAKQIIKDSCQSSKIPNTITFFKCKTCHLEFANPMFAADGNFYAEMDIEKNYYSDRWEFHQSLKSMRLKRKILDIGCGEGRFLEMAQNQGHQVIGLDFNDAALNVARSRGLEVYNCSLRELHKKYHQTFDAVVFFHVIEHLVDLECFFKDLNQLMAIDSDLYFSCPSPKRYSQYLEADLLAGQKEFWDYPPHHQTRWNLKATKRCLERMGWELIHFQTEPFDWRGISTNLADKNLRTRGKSLEQIPSLNRKLAILTQMLKTAIAQFRYSGLSMYCHARKVR
jgi:2-polyprenyl-3-methyl-5-hydroxy-6-metoxy-1,4-benzoquinol methylase